MKTTKIDPVDHIRSQPKGAHITVDEVERVCGGTRREARTALLNAMLAKLVICVCRTKGTTKWNPHLLACARIDEPDLDIDVSFERL